MFVYFSTVYYRPSPALQKLPVIVTYNFLGSCTSVGSGPTQFYDFRYYFWHALSSLFLDDN